MPSSNNTREDSTHGHHQMVKTEITSQERLFRPWFSGDSDGKQSASNAGDSDSIPGSGRSHEEGNGNPVQYSCLENPMERGAWQATVHGVARVRHNLATKPPPTTTFQVRGEETS